MLRSLFAVFLLFISAPAFAADEKISFDGNTFHLAYASENVRNSVNQYILPGETIKKYTKMFGLQVYHNQKDSPEDFAMSVAKNILKQNPKAHVNVSRNKDTGEATVDFLMMVSKNPTVLEFNMFKFRKKPGSATDLEGMLYSIHHTGENIQEFVDYLNQNRIRLAGMMRAQAFPEYVPSKKPA